MMAWIAGRAEAWGKNTNPLVGIGLAFEYYFYEFRNTGVKYCTT